MIAYIDTSALVKRVFREEEADLIDDVWNAADVLLSSHLIYPEARSAAASARRAGRLTATELASTVEGIDDLCDSMELLRLDRIVGASAGAFAQQHGLRGGDAVHLATAAGLPVRRVVVATWDKDLARACTANGIGVIPAHQRPIRPGDVVIR